MFVTTKSLNKKWVDYEDDDNDIVSTNSKGQRVVTTFFTCNNNEQFKCEKVYDVYTEKVKVSQKIIDRHSNWKKFGLDAEHLNEEGFKKYRTIPFEHDEEIVPGEIVGAVVQDDYSLYNTTSAENFELPKKIVNELAKLMNAISSKNPTDAINAITLNTNVQEPLTTIIDRHNSRSIDDERTVRITDIPEFMTEDDLRTIFNRIGDIRRFFLVFNKETNVSRGLAFVTYATEFDAAKAIELLDGVGLYGSIIRVDWSKKQK